jgi:hypothetical protein
MSHVMAARRDKEHVLWDVVDEHLEEADFLFRQWTLALDSPLYTLESLARGIEARMLAHVDALEINDPALLDCLPEGLRQRLHEDAGEPVPLALVSGRADCEALLDHADPAVVASARVLALAAGSKLAFERCLLSAAYTSRVDAQAMTIVALFGEPAHHEVLLEQLDRATHRDAALFALGYSGRLALVPVLLAQLDRPALRTQRLAAEAIALLTGLDTAAAPYVLAAGQPEDADDDVLPPLAVDLARDLVPGPADALPRPDRDALQAWWRADQASFASPDRTLLGAPWSDATVLDALTRLPLRRRHALALFLQVRSAGRVHVDTRALTRTQRAQLARARRMLHAPTNPPRDGAGALEA